MPRVFLNYRREDTAGIAGRLFDRLCAELGRENVFRDLDTLVPGADFAKVIADQVASCDALIAVIGKDWLTARDVDGQRRLDHPDDFVKTEIREALARDKLVIPALVEGAGIPKAADLPPDIAALAGRNAIEISDSRFAYDTERLIRALQAHTDGARDPRSRPAKQRRWWAWVSDPNHQRTLGFIGAGITAAAIAGWTVYVHFSDQVTPVAAPGVTASNGGIAAGGDVTAKAGPGGTAIVATGDVTIGITLEEHNADLKRREQEVREELARTHRDNKEKIALLEKELVAVQAKLQDLEQALSDYKAALAEASQALEKLKGDVPPDQLADARQALSKGDTAAAEALFTEVLAQGKAQAAAGNEKAADAAFQLGALAYQRIDYAHAYDYYLEAAKLQPDNPEYLNMAGRIAYDLGRYAEAHTFWEKALAIREKALGPEHPDVATSLNNLAALYYAQGQYAKAEPLLQRTLVIWAKSFGPEHPDVATSLNNLAGLYHAQGAYAKAEPLYQRALAIVEKSFGREHPHVAASLNNLALVYNDQGEYGKVEPLHQRALAILETALGREHPQVAASLYNLASLYRGQGHYTKAEPLYQRALGIWEKALGPEHPDVATNLNSLGMLFQTQGRYEQAEPLHLRALRIREQALGEKHPDFAQTLNNLGMLYLLQAQYTKAEPLLQRALDIGENALGPEHPHLATGLNNLAELYRAQGQYAKADPLYQRALRIRKATLPSDHPDLAQTMENYAALLGQLNRGDEAKAWQAKADAARERHAGTSPGAE